MAIAVITNQQTQTGNRFAVTFGGVQVGSLQHVTSNDDYGLEPMSGIGDIHVLENVPTMARHSLSVQAVVLNVGAMIAAGAIPENGDAALLGLVFDFEQYDKIAGNLIRKYVGCSYASGSIDVAKHTIVMQSAQFLALDVQGTGA